MMRRNLCTRAGVAALTAGLLLAGCATVGGLHGGHAEGCRAAAERLSAPRNAVRLCDTALLDPALPASDRAATLVNRGILHMHAKNWPAAIADYDAAIRTRPDAAEAYVNKGIALVNMGDRDAEAVAVLTEALARNPLRPAMVHYARAVANEQLGRARAAYEDYSRAAQLAPEWSEPAEQLQRFRIVRGKTASG